MTEALPASWEELLEAQTSLPYWSELQQFVRSERVAHHVFPEPSSVLRALESAPLSELKVVILGQDPYHGPGQANGLAFSVNKGVGLPPSLRNIFKELAADIGAKRTNGDLSDWAEQGVLLLNTTLTVRQSEPASHQGQGWEELTDAIIESCGKLRQPIAFILWGAHARSKARLIRSPNHLVIESAHPSPLSAHRGFFGSRPFSETNDFLARYSIAPIKWS